MKNKSINYQINIHENIDKCIYLKVEEILLVLKVEIIKNNNILNITENLYNKIYNAIFSYIYKNIKNYNTKEFELEIKYIINNLIELDKKGH